MSNQKRAKEASRDATPKRSQTKRDVKSLALAKRSDPELPKTTPPEEMSEDEQLDEDYDDLEPLPLTPEEEDQLDDVLEDMDRKNEENGRHNTPLDESSDDAWHEPWASRPGPTTGQLIQETSRMVEIETVVVVPELAPVSTLPGAVTPSGMLIAHCGTRKITREELALIPVPQATRTHQPLAHHSIVEALVESLAFRHIAVVREEYAVSPDGARMFGVLDLNTEWNGVRFSIGLRNANDKSMRLGMTIGYRVMVCDNMSFKGDFAPVFHKHTRRLDLLDVISIGVDKMQRGFAPLKAQIGEWQHRMISDDAARLIIYRAFLEERFPRNIMAEVHQQYFQPEHEDFKARTLWSLSNAFTTAFKLLKPIRQFTATAKLGIYLDTQARGPLMLAA